MSDCALSHRFESLTGRGLNAKSMSSETNMERGLPQGSTIQMKPDCCPICDVRQIIKTWIAQELLSPLTNLLVQRLLQTLRFARGTEGRQISTAPHPPRVVPLQPRPLAGTDRPPARLRPSPYCASANDFPLDLGLPIHHDVSSPPPGGHPQRTPLDDALFRWNAWRPCPLRSDCTR